MLENKNGYSAQQGISFNKGVGEGRGNYTPGIMHTHTHNIPTFIFLP